MKKLLLALGALTFLCASEVETIVYESETKGKKVKTTWTVEEKGTSYIIKGVSENTDTAIECGVDYTFNKFSEKDKKKSTSYEIDRDGKMLKAEKSVGSKKIFKEFGAHKYPWIQEFNFGLKPFVRSSEKAFKFCILSPDKLNMHNMIAEKLEEEEIELGGKKVMGLKVKVTLQGFKSMFWHGYCWFDQKSGQMLRYQANSGPKTPVTTTDFISSSSSSSLL